MKSSFVVAAAFFSMAGCHKSKQVETLRSGAEKYCQQLQECNCSDPDIEAVNLDTCIDVVENEFSAVTPEAKAAGIVRNDDCIGTFLSILAENYACYTEDEFPEDADAIFEEFDCKFYHGPKKEGETCKYIEDFFSDDCGENLYCSEEKVCSRIDELYLGKGEKCLLDEEEGYCKSGLYCDQTSEVCAEQKTENQTCADAFECEGSLACIDGKCSNGKNSGEDCEDTYECEESLRCAEGKCAERVQENGLCTTTEDCAQYLYCDAQAKKCQKGGAEGAKCVDTDYVCKAGLECSSNITPGGEEDKSQCLPAEPVLCMGF